MNHLVITVNNPVADLLNFSYALFIYILCTTNVKSAHFLLQGRLPVKWMATEALFDKKYTIKSDVWVIFIVSST